MLHASSIMHESTHDDIQENDKSGKFLVNSFGQGRELHVCETNRVITVYKYSCYCKQSDITT